MDHAPTLAARMTGESEGESEAARPTFPPAGFVDRYGAARILGVSFPMVDKLKRSGRLHCDGMLARGPHGVACRIYPIAELERARDAMAAAEAKTNHIPGGFLDSHGAAAFFGTHKNQLGRWQREGRLSRGTWVKVTGRKRFRIYALAELERVKATLDAEKAAEAARPVAPEGFVDLHEAARLLGITASVLGHWREQGRIVPGEWAKIPGVTARTKIYPVAEIERLREEIRVAVENFPPVGWVTMKEAARLAKVSIGVWKNWLMEGRVEDWRWSDVPGMRPCKLFSVAEIERLVVEEGRDHELFMERDGDGGWRAPSGFLGLGETAAFFDVEPRTLLYWQKQGYMARGRWARVPPAASDRTTGRLWRVFPIEEVERLEAEFASSGKSYIDPNDPSLARVPIMGRRDQARFEAIIDAADLPLIEPMRWNWSEGETSAVVGVGPSRTQPRLARVIMGVTQIDRFVAHRNGDPLDCRRCNLVVRDQSDCNGNARKRESVAGRPCTSRFKGVSWDAARERWYAEITKDGVRRRLGRFDDEIAAAQAYDEALIELFGEHARPNFPDGVDARLEAEARETEMRETEAGEGAPESVVAKAA